jgi:alkanesulfonate monooxygenase SsuD/methylene tetrahydromethanopterin reductase-like flavin-dependent oxidoreductase (luciferase family)
LRVDLLLILDAPPVELVRRARCAEEMGFTGVWVADHLGHPSVPESSWHEAWTILGALAAGTSCVRLGPMVSSPVFRHAALLALQAVTVDRLSGGRLELGLGAGGAARDFELAGSDVPEPAERFARFSELVETVDAVLRDAETAQAPRPPLVLAAHAPQALRLAAARADCVNTYAAGDDAVDVIRERMQLVDSECRALGREPVALRRSVASFFGLSEPVPERDEFLAWTQPYREMGVQEFIVYWPRTDSPEGLAALTGMGD